MLARVKMKTAVKVMMMMNLMGGELAIGRAMQRKPLSLLCSMM